jgi:hypothetical protein
MAIFVIEGSDKAAGRTLAATMRNTQIGNGRGCLILDDLAAEADVEVLVEKLIVGDKVPVDVVKHATVEIVDDAPVVKRGIDAIKWKNDPFVIVVGEVGKTLIKKIEERVPGFIAKFSPVSGVSTDAVDVKL